MDLSTDSGTLPTRTTAGGPVLEHELPVSSARCLTESGGTVLLQLLEFKAHLLEAAEELHIRRDAETRFEDQISKLVLQKQELEWEKKSLQRQIETVANQHAQSLNDVKKQFQAKIRNIEEEKGKYQVSAELKDKEVNNLKEELKSLQLLKYNLEKKSSELEQKLALQSRSKDSHLNQLGEVEKRFSALSRQCAVVKQAHENLEQNVDEAMRINMKLTSANGKHEATIVLLQKELEEVRKKLMKAKISSARYDKPCPTGTEQRIQQLHQKLNMEIEINTELGEENVAVRAEKQEVMRSLQHTQQLLLSQTQTLSRVELELQTQREQYQGLKQEHEVMREKSTAMEDKVAQLMESYAASKTCWHKEKATFLDRINSEQQDLQAVTEAYSELHQKHTELSSQAKVQAHHIYELEMRDRSQSPSVSTQISPTLVEEIRREETVTEPISSSELPNFSSLPHTTSTQAKSPDCLEDTGAMTTLAATGATGGLDTPNHHRESQFKQPLNPSNLSGCPITNNNLFSLCSLSGTTGSDASILNKYIHNTNTSESDPEVVSDFIHTTSSVSDDGLLISKGSCVSNTSTVPSYRSTKGSVDLLSKQTIDDGNGGRSEKEQGWKDDVKQGKNNKEEQQWNREEVRGEDVKKGGSTGEKSGTLMGQTADRADRREDSQRSTEATGDTTRTQTETKDRVGGEGTDRVKKRGKTGPHTPETPENQTPAQTTTDTATEKSGTLRVIDFMDTELPLALCEPSDCSQSLCQKVSEKNADSSHVNIAYEIRREVGPKSVIEEVRCLCHDQVQTVVESLTQLPSPVHEVCEKTTEEMPSDKLAANITTDVSDHSQTSTATLAAQLDVIVSTQELETTIAQTQPNKPPDMTSGMKQIHEVCDTHVSIDCTLVRTILEPQPQSQEISKQADGHPKSLVTEDEDGDSGEHKMREGQSNVDTRENDACEAAQEPVGKSNLSSYVDIAMDTEDLDVEVETGSRQEHMRNDNIEDAGGAKTTKCETDLKLSVRTSHERSPKTSSAKLAEQSPAKEILLDDIIESSLPSNRTYRSSFDWCSGQRKTVTSRTKSAVSLLQQFVQGSPMSEQHPSDPGGLRRHPASTMFLKSKHNQVPLVITRASDLLNASSVSGTAASSRRHQQGEWKAVGETATADVVSYRTYCEESRSSLPISSFPVSTSSITVSRLSWQTTPGCSRAPTPPAGPRSGSDPEPSCSQEREDQQSSFREQIAKIEQFLNTERLRLPKRRRTDN